MEVQLILYLWTSTHWIQTSQLTIMLLLPLLIYIFLMVIVGPGHAKVYKGGNSDLSIVMKTRKWIESNGASSFR